MSKAPPEGRIPRHLQGKDDPVTDAFNLLGHAASLKISNSVTDMTREPLGDGFDYVPSLAGEQQIVNHQDDAIIELSWFAKMLCVLRCPQHAKAPRA